MRILLSLILVLLISLPSYAATRLDDEGSRQGYINAIDCVGTGITCSKSGITGTLSIAASALTGSNSHTIGDGSSGDVTLTFDGDAGTDGTFVWDVSEDAFNYSSVLKLLADAAPTVDTAGDIAFDTDHWGSGRGAIVVYDGTASGALVNILVSDTCANGEIPKFNTGGTWTCEVDDDTSGVTIGDTLIAYATSANVLGGEAAFYYDDVTNTLYVDNVSVAASATPTVSFTDSDTTDGDVSAQIVANCTDTGSGTEDCDLTVSQQIAGSMTALLTADADNIVTVNRDIGVDGVVYQSVIDSYSYEAVSTEASGGGGGYGFYMYSNDGAAIAANDRLGLWSAGGAEDGADTLSLGARLQFDAEENWNASSHGTSMSIFTTPNGSTTLTEAISIEQDQSVMLPNGPLFIKEQADADADVAAYGQLWVNTATPNELWFTNDAGTDVQLGVAGGGDVSDVGDCTGSACFTADGTGNNLWLEGASADAFEQIITTADVTVADKTFTFPNDEIASGDLIQGTGAGTFGYTAKSSINLSDFNDDLTHTNDEVGTLTTGDLCVNDGSSVNCTVNTEAEIETALDSLDLVAVSTDDVTSANMATAISDETGTGSVVFGTAPTFTTEITLTPVATPTTDADGEMAVDTDGWGTNFDAWEIYNGTASAYIVATTASDTPLNGQVPKWNTGGEITWENDNSAGSPTFDSITTGDNSTATMTVSGSASLVLGSGGEIDSTTILLEVNNDSGVQIEACTAVYISGFDIPSDFPEISIADADNGAAMPAVGITTAAIANGADGFVIVGGVLEGVDTAVAEVWTEGETIYVNDSGTSASADCGENMTNVRPANTDDNIQAIGRVGRVNAATGKLIVQGAGRSNDVPNLQDNYFWLGNGSNVATAVQFGGDVTSSNDGTMALANDTVAVAEFLASQDWGDMSTDASGNVTVDAGVLDNANMADDALDADKIVGDTVDDDDLDLAAGGTGQSLADPAADGILLWDDSDTGTEWDFAAIGSGLSYDGTTLTATGGSPAFNDVADATAAVSISMDDGESVTFVSAVDGENAFTLDMTDAALAATTKGLVVQTASNDGANWTPFEILDDSGGTPDSLFSVNYQGEVTAAANVSAQDFWGVQAYLTEGAAAGSDSAGSGQYWVENTAPNIPKFTDDDGNDYGIVLDTKTQTLTGKSLTSPTFTGSVDGGGATDFEIPQDQTVNVNGEITIDSTTGQFRYHDGTAQRVAHYEEENCMALWDASDVGTGNNFKVFIAPVAATVTGVSCGIDGTSATVNFQDDADNAIENTFACDNTSPYTWDTTIGGTATLTAGESVEVDVTASSSVTGLIACVRWTRDAD